MSRRCLVFLLLILPVSAALATPQYSDELTVGGKAYQLRLSDDWDQMMYPKKLSGLRKVIEGRCSANWRGYRMLWAINKRKLYLTQIDYRPCRGGVSAETDLSQDVLRVHPPQFAKWVSHDLVIPDGVSVPGFDIYHYTVYARYRVLTVQSGNVVQEAYCFPKEKEGSKDANGTQRMNPVRSIQDCARVMLIKN